MWVALLWVALLWITLLRITLLWVSLLRIALLWVSLLGITLLWIALLRILPLHTSHVALLRIALLSGLHLLAAQLVHHLTNDAAQHAATHHAASRVDADLSGITWLVALLGVVLLRIALLAILSGIDCGLLGRINDVLE